MNEITSACRSTNVRTLGFGRCFCCWEDADVCLVRLRVRPLSVRPRARCSLRLELVRPPGLVRPVRMDSGCFACFSLLEVLADLDLGCGAERKKSDESPHFGCVSRQGAILTFVWNATKLITSHTRYTCIHTRCFCDSSRVLFLL